VLEHPKILQVRNGEIQSNESWVYVWIEQISHLVIYVGSTSSNPELRIWLHLHDPNPDIGRIIARRPAAIEEDFEVLACPVPPFTSRSSVKEFLIQRLSESGQLSVDYIGEPPRGGDVSQEVSVLVEEVLDAISHR
jgi:hypothetical protein